jgi:hypothetical protein
MGVAKTYTKADVQAAMDRANYNLFKQWRSVRSDLTASQFSAQGKDVGHAFRHVDATAEGGKSTYENEETAAQVTMQLLNSASGQKLLKRLDTASPGGSFVEDDPANRKIEGAVTGDWYGSETAGGTKAKITKAACQVMKLGESVLWIHTSYPTAF